MFLCCDLDGMDVLDLHYLLVWCHVWKGLVLSQFLFLFLWGAFSSVYPYNDHPFLISFWELEEPNTDTLRAGLLNSDSLHWPLSGVWALGVQIYWSLFLYIHATFSFAQHNSLNRQQPKSYIWILQGIFKLEFHDLGLMNPRKLWMVCKEV